MKLPTQLQALGPIGVDASNRIDALKAENERLKATIGRQAVRLGEIDAHPELVPFAKNSSGGCIVCGLHYETVTKIYTENARLKKQIEIEKDATTVANNEAVSWKTACGNEFDKAAELEAKLEAMQEQEPVAWTTKGQIQAMDSGFNHYIQGRVPRFVTPGENDVPLYTHPQITEVEDENAGSIYSAGDALQPVDHEQPERKPLQAMIDADRAYIAGLKQGYNYGCVLDERGFIATVEVYRKQLKEAT
jgi:hypothetical protein